MILIFMMTVNSVMSSPASSSSLPLSFPIFTYSSSIEEVEQNEDLLFQVLIKLPVKLLLQCRCVSRKWNHVILNHIFRIIHSRKVRHPICTSLVMVKGGDWIIFPLENDPNQPRAIRKLNFDYIDDDPGVTTKVISSYSGLTLCHVASKYMDYFTYYVTNITTRDFIELPNMLRLLNHRQHKLVLAFDPNRAPDFKVLCASQLRREEHAMEIYSSETREWRKWQGSLINSRYIMDVFNRGVFWNGAIHWLCPRGQSSYFSMDDETMKVLPLPPLKRDWNTIDMVRLMGQSGGHLHLVDVEFAILNNQPIKIYKMENNYKDWVLVQSVRVDQIGSSFPEMVGEFQLDCTGYDSDDDESFLHQCTYYSFAVLSLIWVDDGESLDMILLIPHHIVSYNTKSRETKVLMRIDDYISMHDYKWYDVFQFNDTFSWFPLADAASE